MSKRAPKRAAPDADLWKTTTDAVLAHSTADQARMLRWLVGEQERTGVLEHLQRWMCACEIDGCGHVPAMRSEADAMDACQNCGASRCAQHAVEVRGCSNETCGCYAETAWCQRCVVAECRTCARPLCANCYQAGGPGVHECDVCARK